MDRTKERRSKKENLFRGKKSKKETVIFVPATPGGELRRKYIKTIEDAKAKIAVAEVPGMSIKRRLQKSDPFEDKKCIDKERCMVCEGKGGKCRRTGVTYEVKCRKCEEIYIGETARNAYTRGLEHKKDIDMKNKDSPLNTHNMEKHDGNNREGFEMRVTGVYDGDATKRQVSEAVRIQHAREKGIMNRQDEWRQVKLPRIELCL